MGGSLVTVLILLILDLVLCSPRISHHRLMKSIDKDVTKRHKLKYETYETSEVSAEIPLNENNDDDDDKNRNSIPDIHETCHDENGCAEQMPGRSLRAGDTFTPQEMLPIAKELLLKVKKRGEGKGFVSSISHPQFLADVLFEAYFLTMKRIVTLDPTDISGLDALQALSLSGNVVDLKNTITGSITESPNNKNGENIPSPGPEKCKYKAVTKLDDGALGVSEDVTTPRQKLKFQTKPKGFYLMKGTKHDYEALDVSEDVTTPRKKLKFQTKLKGFSLMKGNSS